uniref:Outer membrane autotransporter barrel domain-containing protein n=1 Tax=Candidatus Kentrum sp. LFY TaxID=2126342 RepID=A0A450WLG6_9GAMM|nr:MAG: outer membrane autotransporter barrel domain-containing protein [Candidatus Kentron sp. LFY]
MSSTLERKVFKNGVKPSRRIKKALVGGISVAATAAMLGMSGQAMALTMSSNGAWKVDGGLVNAADGNDVDLNSYTLTLDDRGTTANVKQVGAVSDANHATKGGDIVITSRASGDDVQYTIKSIRTEHTTATGDANLDINLVDGSNKSVNITVTESVIVQGYMNVTNSETNNVAVDTTSGAGDIVVTVDGNVTVDKASTIKGATGGTAGGSADSTLILKGATINFKEGITLDAEKPGIQGKAILEFAGAAAQTFMTDIKAKDAGDGLIQVTGVGVTFKGKVGDTTGGLSANSVKINADGGTKVGGNTSSVVFEKDVVLLNGISISDATGNGDVYQATFGAPTSGAAMTVAGAIEGAKSGDEFNLKVQGGTANVVTFNDTIGKTDAVKTIKLDHEGQGAAATFKNSVRTTDGIILGEAAAGSNANVYTATFDASTASFTVTSKIDGGAGTGDTSNVIITGGTDKTVTQAADSNWGSTTALSSLKVQTAGTTFISNSTIRAGTVTIDPSTKATFNQAIEGTTSLTINGEATFGAAGSKTASLVFGANSKIILGDAIGKDAKVFGDGTSAVAVNASAGSITIHVSKTGLSDGDVIYLVDSNADILAFDETKYTITDDDANATFTIDNGADPTTNKKQIRLLASVKSSNNQENLNTALTHVSQHIVQNVASTLSSRMDFKRFDNFRGSGSFKGYDKGISSGDAAGMGHSAWVKTFGNWIDQDDEGGISGYDADIYGLVVGMDTEVDKNIRAGVAFGYSNADVDGNGETKATADIDHYQISVYGDYTDEKFYVEGMLGYARGENDTSDLNGTTRRTAKYDSDQYMASVGLGIPVYMGDDIFVTPKGSLTWIHLETDSYTLTGDNTKVNPDDVDSFVGEIGAEIHKKIKQEDGYIIPSAYAGVSYDFAGEEASATIGGTTIAKGIKNEEFAGNVGVGLTYEVGEWSVGAKYDGKFKSGQDSHAATLQARYQF